MKRRKWTNEEKALVVLSGLKGKQIADICTEHGICQAQYYKWRDQFLSNASKAFEVEQKSKTHQRIERENERLKNLVGELTLELKKSEAW